MDLNSEKALLIHTQTIKKKGFLNKIYLDFYKYFKSVKRPIGPLVEIGSGGGFIKDIIPSATTTDVIKGPGIDKIFSATSIPFSKNSISSFVMFDVFHHIKDPEMALAEMYRCLKPKGKIVMIEPYPSPLFGYFVYKYIHHEKKGFDTNSWKVKGKGRMSDANPALTWVVFEKDKKIFEKKFPNLKIVKIFFHTPFKYLLAGGLSKYQLLPDNMYKTVELFENRITVLNKYIGMFMTVELEKI